MNRMNKKSHSEQTIAAMKNKQNIIRSTGQAIGDLSVDRVERISQMAHAMERAAQGIVMLAMTIGDELLAEKASRPHGEFIPWLDSNIERMGLRSARTARDYMKLATNREQIEQQTGITSLRAAFKMLGRGESDPSDKAAPEPNEPIMAAGVVIDPIDLNTINQRSRRGFAVHHVPDALGIAPNHLHAILQWYESKELAAEFRAATGSVKPKAKKPAARISAVIKPKAKRELERRAKRAEMTQGQLIEQLLQFADQVESQIKSNR